MTTVDIIFTMISFIWLAFFIASYWIQKSIGDHEEAAVDRQRIFKMACLVLIYIIIRTTTPMTIETAREIVSRLLNYGFFDMGLVPESELKPINDLSLAEMLEANRLVSEQPPQKVAGGHRTSMTLDERMIAAIYVAHNYEPRHWESKVQILGTRHGALIYVKREEVIA